MTTEAKKLLHELKGSQVPLTNHEAVVLRIAQDQLRWVSFISERHLEVLERAHQEIAAREKRTDDGTAA